MSERTLVPSSFSPLDVLPLPTCIQDAGGAVIYANPELAAQTGLEAGPLCAAGLGALLHPEDRQTLQTQWPRTALDPGPSVHDVRLRLASGGYRWQRLHRRPVWAGSDLAYVLNTLHDLQPQRDAQEHYRGLQALTGTLARAQTLTEVQAALPQVAGVLGATQAHLSVCRGDSLHLLMDGNGAQERTLPLTPGSALAGLLAAGEPVLLSAPALAARFPEWALGTEAWTATPVQALIPLHTGPGGRAVGLLRLGFPSPRPLGTDERGVLQASAALFAQALDRAAWQAERAQAGRTRRVLDTTPQLVWTVNIESGEAQFNPSWRRYTGCPEHAGHEVWREVIHPDDLGLVRAATTPAPQAPFQQEVRLRRRDGAYEWHQVQLTPLQGHEWLGSATNVHQQHEVQLALARSEAQLSAVLDALPVGVLLADPAGHLIRDNAAHRELWGMAPETSRWEEYGEWAGWWPGTGQRIQAHEWGMARALLQGETVRGELVEYQPFGGTERRFFLNNAAPILGAGGQLLGAVVAEQDVTARMAAEQALQQHVERIGLALAAGAILGTWFWDLRHDRFTVDEAFATSFGLDPALGQEGLSLEQVIATVHPDDRPGLVAAIDEAVARGGPYAHEYRVRRRDGQYYWIEANGRVDLDGDGTPLSFPGVLLDVQERRAVLAALRESEERFRELADHISQFAWTADPSGAIGWFNQRWYDYTGTTLEEVQGWGWAQLHHPEHRDEVVRKFSHAVKAGEPWEDTFPLRSRTGEYRWFLSRAVPIRDAQGQIVRWFGTNTDVTAQREAQAQLAELAASLERRVQARTAELERANAELQRSNMELERFAYITSHDLKEPIRTVASFTGLIAQRYGGQLDERAHLYLGMIEKGAERMRALVDDLLTYSRLSGDAAPLQPVDLRTPLTEALARLSRRLEETGARVTVGELPEVLGDGPQLAQLLQNLLSNALKFTRPGVTPEIHLDAAREGQAWHLRVADNGIGIEAAYLQRIFVLFQRLHARDQYEGTGLGLGICQKIVERHGGALWAESTPGVGSTFHFTLPLAPEKASAAP
ncbi:PAS domain-containing protein [Deinococcus arcticus]|uniref:histidine kinase n=1 Tax=Deinococcus arcticus TaxID=2136176 RepID=A0A2T3W5N0_9DEIO|nr:PAS domain-containing protein [Deinococcus arcticus]PTA67191.1 PAS domain-containing protein [Deinococcus arcticus]